MAIAFVGTAPVVALDGAGSGTSGTYASTSGNFLVAVGGATNQAVDQPITSVTDNKGNTYTRAVDSNASPTSRNLSIFYCTNIAGGSGHTFTVNSGSSGGRVFLIVQEFSGIATSSPLDKTASNGNSSNAANATTGTTATTTQADELVVGAVQLGGVTGAVGSGYSNFVAANNIAELDIESKIVAATGTQSASFVNSATAWAAAIVTFKGAASAIAWDAASNSGYQASLSSYSWSHTCTGSNLGLIVNISIFATGTVSSITYNSVALEFIRADSIGVYRNEIWQLSAPASGAHTIAVTLSTSLTSIGSADSYTNVNQTDMIEVHNGATGSVSTAPTVAITSVTDNSWVVSGLTTSDATMSVAGGATQRNNQTGALGTGAISDKGPITPVGSTTMSWSAVGLTDSWAIGTVVLEPVSGTAYAQLLTGVLSFSGSIVKQTNKVVTGTLTFTGAISKLTRYILTATLSFTGSIRKLNSRTLTASLGFAGSLTKQTTRSVAGTLSFMGGFMASHLRFVVFMANLSFSGSLTKKTSRALTAVASFTGAFNKRTARSFTAGLNLVGVFVSIYERAFAIFINLFLTKPAPITIPVTVPGPLAISVVVPASLSIPVVVPAPLTFTVTAK